MLRPAWSGRWRDPTVGGRLRATFRRAQISGNGCALAVECWLPGELVGDGAGVAGMVGGVALISSRRSRRARVMFGAARLPDMSGLAAWLMRHDPG
jgi:hypothetical protein